MSKDSSPVICIVATHAVSLNVLMAGQLEYMSKHWGGRIVLICGGDLCDISALKSRNVGEVCVVPFERKPSLFKDCLCLFRLVDLFRRLRPQRVLYSTPKAMLVGAVASWLARVPKRLALVRGRAYERKSGVKRWAFVWLDRIAVALSTDVLAISNSLASAIANDGIAKRDSIVVPLYGSSNGVDLERFCRERYDCSGIRERLGISAAAFVVVSVGRVCADKGIVDALRAFIAFRERYAGVDACLLFFGANEDPALVDMISDAERHGARALGTLGNPAEAFAVADAHLFLTHREGFGNVAIEAGAMGVPTVAYRTVGVVDSVCDGVTGCLVDFGDVASAGDALGEILLRSNVQRSLFRDQCVGYIQSRFESLQVWQAYFPYYTGGFIGAGVD